ncbi:MAG: hypothetical protein IPM51_11685 [Sphingobacteriaceae bacterium]|nr:hypothetical protein [Sphingobacteriaceae bacterium]
MTEPEIEEIAPIELKKHLFDLTEFCWYVVTFQIDRHTYYYAIKVSHLKKFRTFPPSNLPDDYSITGPYISLGGVLTYLFFDIQSREDFVRFTYEIYN